MPLADESSIRLSEIDHEPTASRVSFARVAAHIDGQANTVIQAVRHTVAAAELGRIAVTFFGLDYAADRIPQKSEIPGPCGAAAQPGRRSG
jgi:hypothetical protein